MASPVSSSDAWFTCIDQRLAEAATAGADLLVMPEYACAQWLSFLPAGVDSRQEVPWMAEQAALILPRLSILVRKWRIALLTGTMPAATAAGWTNRAYLLLPDGDDVIVAAQNKLCLTPGE